MPTYGLWNGRIVVEIGCAGYCSGEQRQAGGLYGCAREECLGDLGLVVSGKGSGLSFGEKGRAGGTIVLNAASRSSSV